MYNQVIDDLRQAYDDKVDERDQKEVEVWKKEQRSQFLALLQAEDKQNLLEIGAGTGVHGKFFCDNGLDVICTDLSPNMVERCRQKGLMAYVMDFLSLDFPVASFDAVFGLNCLLHVPQPELPAVFAIIQKVLKPGGLFYLGQYGGIERAGPWPEDSYEPKRYYSLLTDEAMKEIVGKFFKVEQFKPILLEGDGRMHFQSMVLRQKREDSPYYRIA